MARVAINDCAHSDPRLTAAGRALRMSRERLGWRLTAVWSRVTETNCSVVSTPIVAAALGKKSEDVVDAFIDAELAEYADTDTIDLDPLRSLFGDFEWYADKQATARAGGKARANTSPRNPDGTFASLIPTILTRLRAQPMTRKQLRQALSVRRNGLLRAVRWLIDNGQVREAEHATLVVVEPTAKPVTDQQVPDTDRVTRTDRVPGTHDQVPGTHEAGVPGTHDRVPGTHDRVPSAPAPAPAPAPARESERARATTHTREVETRNRDPDLPAERVSLDSTTLVPIADRRPVARTLWAHQNALRRQLDASVADIPLEDRPGGSLDAVILALSKHTPAQCKHVLDVFAAEGRGFAAEGGDPLEFLNGRTNWRKESMSRALATTPDAMRKRFARRAKAKGGKQAESHRRIQRIS